MTTLLCILIGAAIGVYRSRDDWRALPGQWRAMRIRVEANRADRHAVVVAHREAEREALVQEMLARGLTRIEVDALIIVATAQVDICDGTES